MGLDRDMPRPAHAGSGEQAEADPADLRNRDDAATWRWLPDSRLGTVVVERKVSAHPVIVREVAGQDAAQVAFAQNEDMVEALA